MPPLDLVISIEALPGRLPPGARLLGLDHGSKTIGLALSDTRLQIASPLDTIRRSRFSRDVELLRSFVEKHGVRGLVLGLPLNMDGSEGPRAQSVRAFARNLGTHFDLPLVLWDERLSTHAAERAMLEADMTRKRRANIIDQMAATYILQGALDRLNQLTS